VWLEFQPVNHAIKFQKSWHVVVKLGAVFDKILRLNLIAAPCSASNLKLNHQWLAE